MLQRHLAMAGSKHSLSFYSVSNPRPPCTEITNGLSCATASPMPDGRSNRQRLRQASHVPPNTLEGVPFETDCFVGKALLMYRQAEPGGASPYKSYFDKRKRNWEIRVQGRFKRVPQGKMFIGVVLHDFNYNQPVARYSAFVHKAGMALVNADFKFSWGDRCGAAKQPDAELSHLVTDMSAWDQIIVTPKCRSPPPLSSELQECGDSHGLNLERSKMGLPSYSEAVDEVFRTITSEETYTMCFWGISQIIDLVDWQIKIGYSVSLGKFLEGSPLHLVMYDLATPQESALEAGRRHLESNKSYYFDFMFWSNVVECPDLPSRYVFRDAPQELERLSAPTNGSRSVVARKGHTAHATGPAPTLLPGHHWDDMTQGSLLATWLRRCSWEPAVFAPSAAWALPAGACR